MPARDPLLSPRTIGATPPPNHPRNQEVLVPSMGLPSQSGWNTLYLPNTSTNYDSDDSEGQERDPHRPVGTSHPATSPPRIASGSHFHRPSYSGTPQRPHFLRRGSASTFHSEAFSDTPDGIRSNTAYLADMPHDQNLARSITNHAPISYSHLHLTSSVRDSPSDRSFRPRSSEYPRAPGPLTSIQPSHQVHPERPHAHHDGLRSDSPFALNSSATPDLATVPEAAADSPPKDAGLTSPSALKTSNLTLLMARDKSPSPSRSTEGRNALPRETAGDAKPSSIQDAVSTPGSATPTPTRRNTTILDGTTGDSHSQRSDLESSRLLGTIQNTYGTHPSSTATAYDRDDSSKSTPRLLKINLHHALVSIQNASHELQLGQISTYTSIISTAFYSLPAVLLGLLLNLLDGVSYGYIIFPAGAMFAGFGGLGVSMFFVSTIVAQLTYSLGASTFAGGNGSMMIEVVPFFHILANSIMTDLGEDDPAAVIATVMASFALSSILTGISFFVLGYFRLGNLIGFFPRHILVGCIGGIGVFLVETGFEVSAGINSDEGFTYTWETFELLFGNAHTLALWLPALGLAILLRLITTKFHHQLIFPLYFLSIPIIFYLVKVIIHVDMNTLRETGWVFNVGSSAEPWWKFYTYYNFRKTSFSALQKTLPTQLALLFFNILHPPLNVPALAVSLGEDHVDTNGELVAHGMSNLFSGLLGSVPNYLVYVNTVMVYRVGGDNRISGLMMAVGTAMLLVAGTGPIGYIPIMVVGALIFILGIDLIKEALWDTRHRTSFTEYLTIIAIMVCMSLYDFVIGVLLGIILACFFFVLQNSRRLAVRALYTGATSMSTVRRPSAHREYLREVGKQTIIMRLQGFLFFGTITSVEETIRHLLDVASWEENPIRFLLIDLTMVGGCDMSSAEAFVRIQRLLGLKEVILIFCGVEPESPVGRALQGVNLWVDLGNDVEVFSSLNSAMEWTENAYLRAWFSGPGAQKVERQDKKALVFPGQRQNAPFGLGGESFVNSPRRSHIHSVGERIMQDEEVVRQPYQQAEPINTLMKALSSYADGLDDSFFVKLVPHLKQMVVPKDYVLFKQGDQSDGLYLIEHGVLRARYEFTDRTQVIEESMVSGTLAGELSTLSSMPRNATVFAERQSVIWKLSNHELAKLENEDPETAKVFVKLVLKAAKVDYDVLLAALASHA